MIDVPSQDTLLQWLKNIVRMAEDAKEPTLPTWVLREYRVAQAEKNNSAIEAKYADGGVDEVPSTEGSSTSKTTDDELFNFELVYIKVENTIFSLIKDWPMEAGSTFHDMFSLPVNDTGRMNMATTDGRTKRNPIGVSAKSFQSLLRILYGSRGKPLVTYEEWAGALELSTRWNFTQARNVTVAGIESFVTRKGPAARIRLARQFRVEKWLRTGLTDLAAEVLSSSRYNSSTLSGGDMALDMATIANIFLVCLNTKKALEVSGSDCACLFDKRRLSPMRPYCEGCRQSWQGQPPSREDIEQQVEIVFTVEIAAFQNCD